MAKTSPTKDVIKSKAEARWGALSNFGIQKPSGSFESDIKEGRRVLLQRGVTLEHAAPDPDKGSRVFQFVASSDGVKRDGNRIDNKGWEFENFSKNPVFLWCHDYSSLPIGRHVDWKVEKVNGKHVLKVWSEFCEESMNPFAEKVRLMYEKGYLRAGSVGWIPLEAKSRLDESGEFEGYDFTRSELLEFSAVPVPADPDAIVQAYSRGVLSVDDLDMIVKYGQMPKEFSGIAYTLALPRSKVTRLAETDDEAALSFEANSESSPEPDPEPDPELDLDLDLDPEPDPEPANASLAVELETDQAIEVEAFGEVLAASFEVEATLTETITEELSDECLYEEASIDSEQGQESVQPSIQVSVPETLSASSEDGAIPIASFVEELAPLLVKRFLELMEERELELEAADADVLFDDDNDDDDFILFNITSRMDQLDTKLREISLAVESISGRLDINIPDSRGAVLVSDIAPIEEEDPESGITGSVFLDDAMLLSLESIKRKVGFTTEADEDQDDVVTERLARLRDKIGRQAKPKGNNSEYIKELIRKIRSM